MVKAVPIPRKKKGPGQTRPGRQQICLDTAHLVRLARNRPFTCSLTEASVNF